jgi:hypothetical protein
MRLQILMAFLSLSTCSKVVGQKINSYKYVYKFQLDKPNDVSSVNVDTLQNLDSIEKINGKVIDNKSAPLSFLSIILKSKDTTIYTTTNEKGLFEINTKPSSYELTVSGVNYISVTKDIVIIGKINYNLRVKLARQGPLTWYDINSKIELTKEQIEKIKECVEANENKPIKCGRKNEYYVSIEI